MNDYIVRAIAKKNGVRALVCVTTEMIKDAARRHQTTPIATAALGHGLTAVALLGAQLKVQQRIGLKVSGDGPLRKLVTESDAYGHVRGYVLETDLAWPLPIGAADVADALRSTRLAERIQRFAHEGCLRRHRVDPDREHRQRFGLST